MKTEFIKEFIILAQSLNYTKSAEELFITQPALSRHIQALESELGVRLFQRSTHGTVLTDDGQIVLEYFEKMLLQHDEMLNRLKAQANGLIGRLRLGMLYYGIEEYYELLVRPFKSMYPNVDISIASYQPPTLVEDLLLGKIDIGLTLKAAIPLIDNLKIFDVNQEKMVVLCSDDHQLSNRDKVSVTELGLGPIVFIKNESWHEPYVMELLGRHGIRGITKIYTEQIDTLANTLIDCNAVTIVSRHVTSMRRKRIWFAAIKEEDFEIGITLAYLADNKNACLRVFLDNLSKAALEK